MENKPVAVLAGNMEEYTRSKQHQDLRFIFIPSREKLMGREFANVITIGTFWDRKDASEFYELAKTRIR